MNLSNFDFELPEKLIAQSPIKPRDHCRLMLINRQTQKTEHQHFYDLVDILRPNDVLVFNKSKVLNARLYCKSASHPYEIFLIKNISENTWQTMVQPGKKFQIGSKFQILNKDQKTLSDIETEVIEILEDGTRILKFNSQLSQVGHIPLPPYINPKNADQYENEYQTVYCDENFKKSIAAPTAGLHFTEELIEKLKNKGVQMEFVTLHVGLGTFLPVKTQDIKSHQMHSEFYEIDKKTADNLNQAKANKKRIIAVGTTSARVLESATNNEGFIEEKADETDIFIYPGYVFKFIDSLITNFHLPKSTLLMLVSALADREFVLKVYNEAIKEKYRFYSFGDAMLIE